MRKPGVPIALLLLALIAAAAGYSKHHGSRKATQGTPGVFDYYLLALSWSPEFCYSHADKPECQSGKHGFVVHGLWPQYTDGFPENCSTAPGLSNPAEMADIMPDAGLVTHEWSTHGSCSGLDAESYFKLVHRAFTVDQSAGAVCGSAGEGFHFSPRDQDRICSGKPKPKSGRTDRQLRQQLSDGGFPVPDQRTETYRLPESAGLPRECDPGSSNTLKMCCSIDCSSYRDPLQRPKKWLCSTFSGSADLPKRPTGQMKRAPCRVAVQ